MRFVVCPQCKKVLVDGQWVHGVPPIGAVSTMVCPSCTKVDSPANAPLGKGMVYPEQRKHKR